MRNHITSLLMDYYELTMSNSHIKCNTYNKNCCFEYFFRKHSNQGNYSIFAGINSFLEIIKNFKFKVKEINFLKKQKQFSDKFIEYLKNFKFTCNIWSIAEGSPIFPNEPIIKICGPIIQVQLIETILLLTINHQSLIASKASRIVQAANSKIILEFGARRAQGSDAALYGSRSAYIAGCNATSCVLASKLFNIPLSGTMSHSWVQSFSSEYIAFKNYAKVYPENCSFLIDTYDINKGILNAIKVSKKILEPNGFNMTAIRIDSGNLLELSFKLRKILNNYGYHNTKIIVSNSLDEFKINELIKNKAPIDIFGVGENLISANPDPIFYGVYKLVAIEDEKGTWIPKKKISEDYKKKTIPGRKKLYRFYSKITKQIIFDLICLEDENIKLIHTIYNPRINKYIKINFKNIIFKSLLNKIVDNGNIILEKCNIKIIRKHSLNELNKLNIKYKNINEKHEFPVYFSNKLQKLIIK